MASFKSLALLLLLLPSVVAAQESTHEFRPGQWALQFGGSLNLVTLGIMRFSGPRSAWLLNLDVTGQFLNGTVSNGGGSSDANDHSFFLQAGVGKRFYQSVHSKVRSFQSIGVVGGYMNQDVTFGVGLTSTSKQWFGGLQGQLGGAYWLTPNISLGGTASASASYTHRETVQPAGASALKQHGIAISGVNVALVLGLYF